MDKTLLHSNLHFTYILSHLTLSINYFFLFYVQYIMSPLQDVTFKIYLTKTGRFRYLRPDPCLQYQRTNPPGDGITWDTTLRTSKIGTCVTSKMNVSAAVVAGQGGLWGHKASVSEDQHPRWSKVQHEWPGNSSGLPYIPSVSSGEKDSWQVSYGGKIQIFLLSFCVYVIIRCNC